MGKFQFRKILVPQRLFIKELENNLSVFNQFLKYKELGDKLNIKIVNLSEDSWLDFFDKNNYEKLIENKK